MIEPDYDDIHSLEQADGDNAPPSEPFYAFEEDDDIYDDDDLCPYCGEPFDCCVCADEEFDE